MPDLRDTLRCLRGLQELDRDLYRIHDELRRLPQELDRKRGKIDAEAARLAELERQLMGVKVRIKEIDDLTTSLAPAQVERLCEAGTRISFGRGEVIYRQGEPARHIFLLLDGEAQSTLLNFAGNETLLRIHLPGSILGAIVGFATQKYPKPA